MIANCQACQNRTPVEELRQDPNDGKRVCADCFTGGTKIGSQLATKVANQPTPKRTPQAPGTQRDTLIQYIVVHADKAFIENTCASAIEKLRFTLTQEYAWISLVEQVDDTNVLLRIASDLGYGKKREKKSHGSVVKG